MRGERGWETLGHWVTIEGVWHDVIVRRVWRRSLWRKKSTCAHDGGDGHDWYPAERAVSVCVRS